MYVQRTHTPVSHPVSNSYQLAGPCLLHPQTSQIQTLSNGQTLDLTSRWRQRLCHMLRKSLSSIQMMLREQDHRQNIVCFEDALRVVLRVWGQSGCTKLCRRMFIRWEKSLTDLPSRVCSRAVTACTAFGSSNVKNANPREVPAGSRMIVQASTL